MSKEEMLKELATRPYDLVSNHYYQMEKEELKDIITEILVQFEGSQYEKVKRNLVENLKEYRDWA